MTLTEFIEKYNNIAVDFDKAYGYQCFDLYRQYCKDVLKVPQSPATGDSGAVAIWDTYLKNYFVRIENKPDNFPQAGDIVIWGTGYGKYGHVAICVNATVNTLQCFSQNDPVGTLCRVRQYRSYKHILGWIRPKSGIIPEEMAPWITTMFGEIGIDLTKSEGEIRARVQEVIDGFKKYKELETRIHDLEKQVANVSGEAAQFETELTQALQNRKKDQEEIADLRKSIALRDTEIGKLSDRLKIVETQIDPEKMVVISKEEFRRLSQNDLKKYTLFQLLSELIKRVTMRRG